MKYLGIDYGSAHIGLAVGDDEVFLSLPFDTIHEKDLAKQIQRIKDVVEQEDIDVLVLGHPLTMAGEEGNQSKATQKFTKQLSKSIDIQIHTSDERLSSQYAQGLLRGNEGGKQDEHAIAATTILQTFLDRKKIISS